MPGAITYRKHCLNSIFKRTLLYLSRVIVVNIIHTSVAQMLCSGDQNESKPSKI